MVTGAAFIRWATNCVGHPRAGNASGHRQTHARSKILIRSTSPLQIERVLRGTQLHLLLRGELDIATAPLLEEALAQAQDGLDAVFLDLSQLRFIDSSGLRAVLAGHTRAQRDGAALRVIAGDGRVKRLFAIAGVSAMLDVREAAPAGS